MEEKLIWAIFPTFLGGFGILVRMYVQLSVLEEKLKYQGKQIGALLDKAGFTAVSGKSED